MTGGSAVMSSAANPQTKPRPLANLSGTILLAGAGKMGSAMLEGWLALGLAPGMIAVIEPQPSREIAALGARGLRLNPPREALGDVAAVVIAVKPQVAGEVVPALAPFVGGSSVVVSIMAGRTLQFLAAGFPRAAIVRAMPNTPAAIGRGMTVAVANARVSDAQRALVDALLSAVGIVEWVAAEALMDAVTALSGSGPAYVFLLAAAMARPGTRAGALEVLMAEGGLERLMTTAIAAATKRSRDLAG